ncbi:unnamed protein product [Cunninghamella blakesleeana]
MYSISHGLVPILEVKLFGVTEPSHLNNTLHHDRTLATGSRYNPNPSYNTSSFRSKVNHQDYSSSYNNQEFDHFASGSSSSSSKSLFTPTIIPNSVSHHSHQQNEALSEMNLPLPGSHQHLQLASMSAMDGAEVLAFLNNAPSEVYHEEIHGDDLIEGSMSYNSYQHQADHQHSLAELERVRQQKLEDWILSDDIMEYIEKYDSTYVNDIYGLPPIIEKLIKEAKEEIKEKNGIEDAPLKAVHRLQMIRNHLIGVSNGNKSMAVQQGLKMDNDDWAALF